MLLVITTSILLVVSPYLKSLSMVAANKLLHLLEVSVFVTGCEKLVHWYGEGQGRLFHSIYFCLIASDKKN